MKILLSFPAVLTILFVILKCTGTVHWSWVWVFMPVLISSGIGALVGLLAVLFLVLAFIGAMWSETR